MSTSRTEENFGQVDGCSSAEASNLDADISRLQAEIQKNNEEWRADPYWSMMQGGGPYCEKHNTLDKELSKLLGFDENGKTRNSQCVGLKKAAPTEALPSMIDTAALVQGVPLEDEALLENETLLEDEALPSMIDTVALLQGVPLEDEALLED